MVMAPVWVPMAVGVNLTLNPQLDPAASDEPHVVFSLKFPLMAMLVIFSAAVPVLLKVIFCDGLVPPTLREPKLKLVGERLTTGTAPVPVRSTVCGLLPALSVIVTAPRRVPVAVGVNVTLIVQLAPAASVLPHVG